MVLAAGEGRRLRPLTDDRPKVLCQVGGVALIDRNIADVAPHASSIAVNAHHHRQLLVAHLRRRWPLVHVSVEEPEALGTAGAIGQLRGWLNGRDALVVNGDGYRTGSLDALVAGWDRARPRLLVVRDDRRGDFGPWRFAGASLLPWDAAARLEPVPSGLYEACWRSFEREDALELIEHRGLFIDCGTPADYLRANFHAATHSPPSTSG